eukprot:m.418010 g.418010  ORF g.418010 m.418010 type:complete len:93 (+) comp21288_c0_seq50:833-1111(+)
MAVRAGHTDVVQFLLLNQATTDHVTGSTQRTPLHDAAAHGHVAVCYILLQHNASLTATVCHPCVCGVSHQNTKIAWKYFFGMHPSRGMNTWR